MDPRKIFFATPQEAESAFYDALERADLEAMMTVWAEDEEIICVHPGGQRLSGYAAVRESWRQIFANGAHLRVRISHQVYLQGLLLSVHSLHENISVIGSGAAQPPIAATNVYLRGAQGWRMLAHHASVSSALAEQIGDAPKILH